MKNLKRLAALVLSLTLALSLGCLTASAKTVANGQTVDTVLFYVKNAAGEDILVSHVTVAEMEADLTAGALDDTVHNYSILDRYVTTVHQEAQGLTIPEFVAYAQSKSTLDSLKSLDLTFQGSDTIAFWEIDGTGYDQVDTYTYDDLYGVERYNFPLLYQYWNYTTQDYYDPAGVMSREEVIDYIFSHGEPETVRLSVRAFSQRYIVTDEKYGTGDYNMENLWQSQGKLDSQRTPRLMLPMTESDLRNKKSTASDGRYWNANLRLDMAQDPEIQSLGQVATPTAVMTEDGDNYYITFTCATAGATILYNHNTQNPSYTPTCAYEGRAVVVPKSDFPGGTVTMTCRAVKDGYTDGGVQTLTLTSSGAYTPEQEDQTPAASDTSAAWQNPFTDVAGGSWYYTAVAFVNQKNLFNGTGDGSTFSPDGTMTRSMFATVLHRYYDTPAPAGAAPFDDIPANDWYSDAVAWAYEQGHMNGTGGNKFSPEGEISLEQMLTVLWRCAGSPQPSAALPTDLGPVSTWAADAVRWAGETGLLTDVGGALTAQGAATRAQVAGILKNFAG
jgi:hypothetical protein